jgi:hypothetical protein
MVPLDREHRFRERVAGEPHLRALSLLLSREYDDASVVPLHDAPEVDKIYYSLVKAIGTSDLDLFSRNYAELSKRVVVGDSPAPFIHNDNLLFVTILGIRINGLSEEWVRGVLSVRQASPMKETLLNLLKGDTENSNSIACISLCFASMLPQRPLSAALVNRAYSEVAKAFGLFEDRNDLIIICSLRARDLVFESKAMIGEGELGLLTRFEHDFWLRSKYIIYALVNGAGLYGLYRVYRATQESDKLKDMVSGWESILGIVGLGLFAGTFVLLRKWIHRYFMLLLGYPRDLLMARRSIREKES